MIPSKNDLTSDIAIIFSFVAANSTSFVKALLKRVFLSICQSFLFNSKIILHK